MSKIKINLSNGVVVEKPLISCFKGVNGSYIIFDNESVGASGYPIICISKFNGDSCEKIIDNNEWVSVKECLKKIISGDVFSYLNVPESLTAGENFFTQLTLPVTSFDIIKNAYKPAALETVSVPDAQQSNEVSVQPDAVEEEKSDMGEPVTISTIPVQNPSVSAPTISDSVIPATSETVDSAAPDPIIPVVPAPSVSATPRPVVPVVSAPAVAVTPMPVVSPIEISKSESVAPTAVSPDPVIEPVMITPVAPASNVENEVSTNTNDMVEITPVIETPLPPVTPSVGADIDYDVLKKEFMNSCEKLFDDLIKKIKK